MDTTENKPKRQKARAIQKFVPSFRDDQIMHAAVLKAVKNLKLFPAAEEVVLLAVDGLSNQEIAVIRNLQLKSVKFHFTRIFRKTKMSSRSRLLTYIWKNAFELKKNDLTIGNNSLKKSSVFHK